MKKYILMGGVLLFVFALSANFTFAATTYSLVGDAAIVAGGNSGNAAQIRSSATIAPSYGGVSIVLGSPIPWASLVTVSTDFNVTDDNCGGGSPRVQIRVDTNNDGASDGSVRVSFGPSPNFTGCSADWQSTGNLIGNADAGRYDYSVFGGSPFTTYSNAPTSVTAGQVVGVFVVVDGSWSAAATGGDGEQTTLIDNINVNGDVTTFDIARSAKITSPNADEEVSGMVDFAAYLVDDDADAIQWAVRKGTCAANTSTVFGNVDGHSDSATIDSSDFAMQTFSFTGDMSTMDPGMYCFIYNPTEDSGEANIRETVQFNLVAPPAPPVPTSMDECKNGGWKTFTNPIFKNQGACVSYVQSNANAGKRN